MRRAAIVVTLLTLTSCAVTTPAPPSTAEGMPVVHEPNPEPELGNVSIRFESRETIIADEIRMAADRRITLTPEAASIGVPEGGIVHVTTRRSTLDAANPDQFEYVVVQNGEETHRGMGRSKIPRVPSAAPIRLWSGSHAVPVPEPITGPVEIYVIDTLFGGRDRFVIGG